MIWRRTLRRYWPPETQIMLLRALTAEPTAARAAWRAWTALRDLDSATAEEVRLLANLASRLHLIDPGSPLEPRIQGIRRFVWTHTQLRLTGARPLLAALAEAGIPMVALKGAARVLAGTPQAGVRFLRDVDVLVRPADWTDALRIADAQGWRCCLGTPYAGALEAGTPARVYPVHHAVALARGRAQVDLHHHALYMCRVTGDDDGMWARATPARLNGVPVLAPSATDELMQALAHGAQYSPKPIADWALDAAALIAGGQVDWALLEQDAQARRIEAFVACSLMLLEERLEVPVPAGLTRRLRRRVRGVFVTDFVGYASGTEDYPWMYDTNRRAAALRADSPARGRPGAAARRGAPARQTVLAGKGLRFPEDGTPVTIPVPTPLPPDGRLRLLIDVVVGVVPPRESLVIAIRAPGVPLRWWRTRLRGRWAGWRRRRRLQIDLPTRFYAGRGIDRVTVDLYTPGPGRTAAVMGFSARWIVETPAVA
jgi:hypothetical protein